jgi:beta-galactosamide-alpha-2,3-sialyltransferase
MKDVDSMNQVNKRSALLLLRTPFQARMAERILQDETVSAYDLVYFTQDDSIEDRYYFNRLSAKANNAQYCYAPRRLFDILSHFNFCYQAKKWYENQGHDLTLLASINAHVINAISRKQVQSELVTFDDGLVNIGSWGPYYIDGLQWRNSFYRKIMGTANLASTKSRIARHYTLYPQFENIVETGRLKTLCGWRRYDEQSIDCTTKTYFIGQPFEEVLTFDQIAGLKKYLKTLAIDLYVRHPREKISLNLGVPYLNKRGQIAEDAIVSDAGLSQVHLIGWFSTVLFNLGNVAQRRTMLLINSDPTTNEMAKFATKAGCEVVLI